MSCTSIYKRFSSNTVPKTADDQPIWCFVFNSGNLLVKVQNGIGNVPIKIDMEQLNAWGTHKYYLGQLDGCDCYCIETSDNITIPEGTSFRKFYSMLDKIDEEIFMLAGRAYQILNWDKKNRYCGSCGAKTSIKQDELAKVCYNCSNIIYPKISPAVIVAVTNGNKILLARARNLPKNLFSLIAGFAEPGETLENCVHREVLEEVGIRIKNVRYFGSQPWPFPDSLMIGFTAEYESGEISVDVNEIVCADWFDSTNLPNVPTKSSIAGKIINWFCENV